MRENSKPRGHISARDAERGWEIKSKSRDEGPSVAVMEGKEGCSLGLICGPSFSTPDKQKHVPSTEQLGDF